MSETCSGHLWEKIIVKLFASSWYIFVTYICDARSHLHQRHNVITAVQNLLHNIPNKPRILWQLADFGLMLQILAVYLISSSEGTGKLFWLHVCPCNTHTHLRNCSLTFIRAVAAIPEDSNLQGYESVFLSKQFMMFQQIIIPLSSRFNNPGRMALHVEYFHTPHCIPSTIHDPSHHTINNSAPIFSHHPVP